MPRRLCEQVCQGTDVLLAGSAVGANVYDDPADGGGTVLAPENHYWEF